MEQDAALSSFVPEALAASGVGTWDYDVKGGLFCLDPVASNLLGFDPEDGRRGLPHVVFLAAINAVDRARGADDMKRLLRDGGDFVFEHRVNPPPPVERWLLAKGHYEKGPNGDVVRGRGIVLDITHCKANGCVEGIAILSQAYDPLRLYVSAAEPRKADDNGRALALLEMTEHLIAAHRIAKAQRHEATLEIVTVAMAHAGRRLQNEVDRDVQSGRA